MLTKPAGCFVQLLSIPVFFWGAYQTSASLGGTGKETTLLGAAWGVALLVLSFWMLAKGREPSVRK